MTAGLHRTLLGIYILIAAGVFLYLGFPSEALRTYAGQYLLPNGAVVETQLKEDGFLYLVVPGQPPIHLIPYKKHRFKVKEYSDLLFEFVVGNKGVSAMKQVDPSGVYEFKRK